MKLGFIGTGVITEAIVLGILKADYPIEELLVSVRTREISARLAELSNKIRVCEDNAEIIDMADLLFLAIRPQDAEQILSSLEFRAGQQIVSLIATIPIDQLHEWTHPSATICRAIPLPSVADLTGVTAIFPPSPAVEALFNALGTTVPTNTIAEFDSFAVASAMMGLYFGISEAAAQWLCAQGTDYDGARAYLSTMFLGLANTASQSPGENFEELRLRHTTPNGLNDQLFLRFVEEGGRQALADACQSVAERMRKMH
jgi:pyrroline-5-carboxylate reductase